MNEYFTKYILIGGMPSAVASYVEFKNLSLVKKIHSDILMGYEDDINKHAGDKLKNKILSCFKSIPSQLSKDNTKFMFNLVKKNAKFERYEDCFKWLELAGIIICVNNLTDVSLPLSSCALKHNFKIYLKDTGLLISLLGPDGYDDIINNDIKVFKGAIYENVFADLIVKKNIVPYFFDQSKGFEIDFVTTINSKLNLLEVKSSNNRTKSIKTFFSEYKNKLKNFKCYKFIKGKSGVCEEFSTLPH
jgi:predicted AAA+ superfamily ATPase